MEKLVLIPVDESLVGALGADLHRTLILHNRGIRIGNIFTLEVFLLPTQHVLVQMRFQFEF